MIKTSEIRDSEAKTGFLTLIKRLWPHFLINNTYAFTVAMLYINIVIVAGIVWPNDIPFAFELHAAELGILTGASVYMIAVSGIIFGTLADKYSRIKLMVFVEIIYGIGLFFNGFVPEGQGQATYFYFLVFSLIRGFSIGGVLPLINSHVNDSTEEKERSQFFGLIQGLFQFFQIIGMVISAISFQTNFWRYFFVIVGSFALIFGILIVIKGKEPKRGAMRKELKDVLSNENVTYEFKLTRDTIRSTIFAPTNLIAFFEGIFTTVLIAVPDFLLVAYLQSPPYNLSPLVLSFFLIIFGLPGGLFGALAFAKISDKLGKKNIKYRIYMIVLSVIILFTGFIFFFTLPIPAMTVYQGNNLLFIFSIPTFWILGVIMFIGRSFIGIWNINQAPILQEINLPEAQGKISSANQFLEAIGSGTGPILAGFILLAFNQNFQITALLTLILGIFGGLLWLLATIWVNNDVKRVSDILKLREGELKRNSEL
ncbi:MAG: MFS transporter [Candidatus Thorarchaeota archaeon]